MSFQIDTSKIVMRPVTVTFFEMHESTVPPEPLPNTRFELLPKPIDVKKIQEILLCRWRKTFLARPDGNAG